MKKLLIGLGALGLVALGLFVLPLKGRAQLASITMDWTSPGDDGNTGTATSYDMRWSVTRPDTTSASARDAWWAAATQVAGMPAPLVAGTAQSKVVAPAGGFPNGRTIYFVIRATDDVGNQSDFSNVAWFFVPDVTKPGPIIDLRPR